MLQKHPPSILLVSLVLIIVAIGVCELTWVLELSWVLLCPVFIKPINFKFVNELVYSNFQNMKQCCENIHLQSCLLHLCSWSMLSVFVSSLEWQNCLVSHYNLHLQSQVILCSLMNLLNFQKMKQWCQAFIFNLTCFTCAHDRCYEFLRCS